MTIPGPPICVDCGKETHGCGVDRGVPGTICRGMVYHVKEGIFLCQECRDERETLNGKDW